MESLSLDVNVIENYVLFFLAKNHKNAANDNIIRVCKDNFTDPEICAAKQWIADNYHDVVKEIDEIVAENLLTVRRGGPVTCKLRLVITDIFKAFDALDASKAEFKFVASAYSRIPEFNSENMTIKAVMEKLKSFEERLISAEGEIVKLKDENTKLYNANQELRNECKSKSVSTDVGQGVAGGEGRGVGGGVEQQVPSPGPLPSTPSLSPPSTSGTNPNVKNALPIPLAGAAALQKPQRSRLTNKQKYEVNQICLKSALEAATLAVESGTPQLEAIDIGKGIGEVKAKTWAQMTKQSNLATRIAAVAQNVPAVSSLLNYPALNPSRAATAANVAGNQGDANRKKLSKVSPYRRGGSANIGNSNIIMQRPALIKNKCLVIQGLKKGISREQCLNFINNTAGKNINVLHIQILSKVYSPWLTVAIEINNDDYAILSDIGIWDASIAIRDYVGWRKWHGPRPQKLAAHVIKNSVHDSWLPDEEDNS